MTRVRYSAPIDPNDRFAQQIKQLQDQVAELQRAMSVVSATAYVNFAPSGTTDISSTATSYTTWLSTGNVTVPEWATAADVDLVAYGVYDVTQPNMRFFYRAVIGTDVTSGGTLQTGIGLANRHAIPIRGRVALTATGTKALVLQGQYSGGGDGRTRADTSSRVVGWITWRA